MLLKWLKICTSAVGVDHRITVSVAVNQGICFYLGCPKSARFNYNSTALKKRKKIQKILKTFQKTAIREATRDFWMDGNKEHKSWKHINYHSHLQKTKTKQKPSKDETFCVRDHFNDMFAWVSELSSQKNSHLSSVKFLDSILVNQ